MNEDPYDPPRGRSTGRWLLLSAVALLVIGAMVIATLGGLGVFSERVPSPRPTDDARTAATEAPEDASTDPAWWRVLHDQAGPAVSVGTLERGETARIVVRLPTGEVVRVPQLGKVAVEG